MKVTKRMAAYHAELRALLTYMHGQPHTTGTDIQSYFDIPAYQAGRMTRRLIELGFITTVGRARYSVLTYELLEYTAKQVEELLPVVKTPTVSTRVRVDRLEPTQYNRNFVGRDPLDTLLMGTGMAPSITFKRSYAAHP